MVIGSTVSGLNPAGGAFDEVCLFWRPLTGAEVARYYRASSKTVALGPVSEEAIARRTAAAALRKAQAQRAGGAQMDSLRNCTGGGLVLLTDIISVSADNGTRTV